MRRSLSAVSLLTLMLTACQSNRPPKILRINDLVVDAKLAKKEGMRQPDPPVLFFQPGVPLEIVVEAEDPEGLPLRMWWTTPPDDFTFDPDGDRTVWTPPADWPEDYYHSALIVQDTEDGDEAYAVKYVQFIIGNAEALVRDSGW